MADFEAEREAAIARLRGHYARGEIDADDLAARITRAHYADQPAQLRAALRDLPRPPGRPRLADLVADPRRHAGLFAAGAALLVGAALATGSGWPYLLLAAWALALAGQLAGLFFR